MAKKIYWVGFCDGKVFTFQNLSGANVAELFTNRKHAKKVYRDVRKVEIREVKK